MKKIKPIWIVAIIIGAVFALNQSGFLGAITGLERMTRTGPSTVSPNEDFTITYTVTDASGKWGVSIIDTISGGCRFGTENERKDVMLSESGTTKTVIVKAPEDGTCTFSGDYKFGTESIRSLNTLTVNIASGPCTPECTRPSNLCIAADAVEDGCGGLCTGEWTVQQLTDADNDCSNSIDRLELGYAITSWINNDISRSDLGLAIMSWSGG